MSESATLHYLDYSEPRNRVLSRVLCEQAEHNGTTVFLRCEGEAYSYSATLDRVGRLAAALGQLGVGRGDHVCLFMASCADYVFLTLACNFLGARWIPVNTDYRGTWLRDTILESEPKLLISDRQHQPHLEAAAVTGLQPLLRDAPSPPNMESLLRNAPRGADPVDVDYGETSAILWTSGTTGRAKGVMQSHNNWIRAALSAAELGDVGEGDVLYNCLPLYNSAAWVANIYPALISGTTVAMDPGFSAGAFWERTRHYGATHVFTLGAMHMFLWNAPELPTDGDNPVRSANMVPMPDAVHRPFCERFGIDAIHQGFGQSEVMLLLRRKDDSQTAYPPGALGEPAPDLEVALLDDGDQPVPPGEIGEICVQPLAPHVLFNGYYNAPKETEAAFRSGWYHTGDLGRQDDQGHYFFVDRKKDVIRYKGRNVSSVAVENVARQHPDLAEVAVFGVPSDELEAEHEIMLTAVRKPGAKLAEEDLARFINQNAPYFFVPRYIEWLEALPLTPTQKVRKVELRGRGVGSRTWDARAAGFKPAR